MKKDPKINLAFTLECIELIEKYLKDIKEDQFLNSTQLQDAIIRRIELIGEAIKNISLEVKDKHPEIHWGRITGMRNILIHDYLGIDLKTTWQVATREIPELKNKILEIEKELERENT